FVLLARGPGEPIGAGGRYDTLLARFGLDLPATGFGLDVGNLEWALEAAGRRFEAPRRPRVVVSGPARERFAASLREAGADVAVLESGDACAYASAWGLDAAAVTSKEAGARAHRLRDGREKIVRSARALLSFLQSGASR
ncbi:MAG: ATP phosphoribosyltransferase regulatory subunit, partial [Sandaracinaceae bacterium]|nr:ATP phosphoribosyltransferase regulatory subunit [Sandaracinaceae bacterium]